MRQTARYILSLIFCSLLLPAGAQDKSNRGKEFWLGYGYNSWFFSPDGALPANSQELNLYLSTEAPANVTVSIPATGWSQTVAVPANTVNATVLIPKTGINDARITAEGLSNKAIHIVSDTPIVVFAHMYNTQTSGATMLIPVETYGYKYYSLNYSQSQSNSKVPTSYSTTTSNAPNWYSWFYVVASEDNTRLQITPSDTTQGGVLPGQTFTVNLNKGEIYNVMGKIVNGGNQLWQASKDLTGSKVLSVPGNDGNCHPFALFSGSGGIRLCYFDGGEIMMQQAFPVQAWGTRYLTYHMLNNTTTDINDPFKNFYRIAVDDPTTVVRRNGVPMTGLVNNFYYEVIDSTGGDYYTADKPFMVAQYTPGGNRCWNNSQFAYGDPEMIYLSPVEQGSKDALFYANRKTFIDYNYLNVLVQTTGIPSLRIDGNLFNPANIIPHPNNPAYSVAVSRIAGAAGQHRLTCDSVFNATIYGLGFFESYGYNVGTFVNNLNHYSMIQNTFNFSGITDTFTCPKTPVRLFVKVGYPATSITWKLSQVPGMSPNTTDSIINNPVPIRTEQINNRTYYVYTLQQDFTFNNTGVFTIPVSYTATVIENCSQTEYATVRVTVKPGPAADFSFTDPACLNDTLQFTGTSQWGTFTPVAYRWDFPDNTVAVSKDTLKKFSSAGTHAVRYRIYASNGCAGDTTKMVTVNENPLAAFTASATVICAGDSVQFTDNSSISSGSLTNRHWIFGDGNTANRPDGSPFFHRYTMAGNYTVMLITEAANGCVSDTASLAINVLPRPLAKFGYSRNICAGDSVLLSDSSQAGAGVLNSWHWNFGDGNSITHTNGNPFYHTYNTPGNYTISLVAGSSSSCKSDTFKVTVTVNNRPAATISSSGLPCVDSVQQFSSSFTYNSSNPATYYWDFGDGQTTSSTASGSITHNYTSPQANITVKHAVALGPGCVSDTATLVIPLIQVNPVASFTILADTFCENKPVRFTAPPNAAVNNWNWNFGNGTGTQTPPVTRTYATAGNYTISLQVKTAAGCASSPYTQSLTINPSPVISAGPDKFISQGASVTLDATAVNAAAYNFLWSPGTYLNNNTVLNPVSTPDATITYTLQAVDRVNLCTATDQVVITPVSKLYIPNAFTPNNDGLNDQWRIPGLAIYPGAVVSIFNREGQKLYESKNYFTQPWNGMYKGVAVPNAVYVYLIQLNDDKKQLLKGTVTVIR